MFYLLQYTLEAPIGTTTQVSGAADYILQVFTYMIGAVGLLALGALVYGGIVYMTGGDNSSKKQAGKGIMTDAIIGLIIALGGYLILYTINPGLTELIDPEVEPVTPVAALNPPPGYTPPPAPPAGSTLCSSICTEQQARDMLAAAGIGVNKTCINKTAVLSQTCLDGISINVINGLINLKNQTGCSFRVTGGTEAGHQSHGGGTKADITEMACLTSALANPTAYGINQVCTTSAYLYLRKNCGTYVESAPHFHLGFY